MLILGWVRSTMRRLTHASQTLHIWKQHRNRNIHLFLYRWIKMIQSIMQQIIVVSWNYCDRTIMPGLSSAISILCNALSKTRLTQVQCIKPATAVNAFSFQTLSVTEADMLNGNTSRVHRSQSRVCKEQRSTKIAVSITINTLSPS